MDQNSKLAKLFAVLKTIADLGPVATADNEFSDASRQILERVAGAFEAEQAALLMLDGAGAKLVCIATSGFASLVPQLVLQIPAGAAQNWQQTRVSRLAVRPQDIQELFGASQAPFLSSIRCLVPLRVNTGPVGALLFGARHNQESYSAGDAEGLDMLAPHLALVLHNHSLAESLRHQIADNLLAQAASQFAAGGRSAVTLLQSVPNPFFLNGQALALTAPTTTQGQLLRPFPQYASVALAGQGSFDSIFHSLQVTARRRFAGAGSLLVAYTNAKLISDTDTLTSWLETSVGGIQDNNNLRRERSLSSQDVPQRLVASYVLDLPFGQGKRFFPGVSGHLNKLIAGWGIDGVTTLQRGFPLVFGNGQVNDATLFGTGSRPNVVPGCQKSTSGSSTARLNRWFNPACFAAPADFTFGNESRVDATLRSDGIDNFDLALFKRTMFGLDERVSVEFRTEFFNLFNRTQFALPNTICCSSNNADFVVVTSTAPGTNPRLVQFAMKLLF